MCWSKRSSSPDFSTDTTTFTPTGSTAVNYIPEYCKYPAVECSQNATDRYCSFNGKCCEIKAVPTYCACATGYKGKYCESLDDPWLQESLQANTTIGIAVGVIVFFVFVVVAIFVSVAVFRCYKKKITTSGVNAGSTTPVVDHNSNSTNGTSQEESKTMLPKV